MDDKQIKEWLKQGTITKEQAQKMLADTNKSQDTDKSNKFVGIIAIIGAVLILVGIAWLLATNWHDIAAFVKVIIMTVLTLGALAGGVFARKSDHENIAKALITLGSMLFVLSLFLVSQAYNIPSSAQHYAWLLLAGWIIILLIAYMLEVTQTLFVGMLTFFAWVMTQYTASLTYHSDSFILSFVALLLGVGTLLFAISTYHKSVEHKFTNTYRFWTSFYLLLIFYILSFQMVLPTLSDYSLSNAGFTTFSVGFLVVSALAFVLISLFTVRKSSVSLTEIFIFLGIIVVIGLLVLSTKTGEGLVGYCEAKSCYNFNTQNTCPTAPAQLNCKWQPAQNAATDSGNCYAQSCYNFVTSSTCAAAPAQLACYWKPYENAIDQNAGFCASNLTQYPLYETCRANNNQKNACVANQACNWSASSRYWDNEKLPTSLWILWVVNNIVFIGFIILILAYAISIGSTKLVNLGVFAFALDVVSRYIGFWIDLKGYFAFSMLAIIGGILLIIGAWLLPKWKRALIAKFEGANGKK